MTPGQAWQSMLGLALAESAFPAGTPVQGSGLEALLTNYRPLAGTYDEMMQPDGTIRPVWRDMLEGLGAISTADLEARFASADQHMRDAGVIYRVYGKDGGSDRPWPLSHMPVLLGDQDWAHLNAAMKQRAQLLEATLADIYGSQSLVTRGLLPAELVAASPEFLRPAVGIRPRGGSFLRLYAADFGRGPGGRWWVLQDFAQAPSGLGYALENRTALSRALPEFIEAVGVERLSGFIGSLRESLGDLRRYDDALMAVLTPGASNETYFEHAALAQLLGFLLVEGADLSVRNGEVRVRTVDGLRRLDVLLRRIDADYADPLELNPASGIGAPGLMQAVRRGGVAFANALGAAFVETPALMGFWPRLCEETLGEALIAPNIATWWAGQPSERERILEQFEQMVVGSAFHRHDPTGLTQQTISSALNASQSQRLRDAIRARGRDFIGQEAVQLSTTPTFVERQLSPRPCVLRLYAARVGEDWHVLPGAFCRISDTQDARAVSMQQGSRSADAWVVTAAAPQFDRLATLKDQPGASAIERAPRLTIRRTTGDLTSRAADGLFWLGRYLERAEMTARLVREMGRLEAGRGTQQAADWVRGICVRWVGLSDSLATHVEKLAEQAITGPSVGALGVVLGRALTAAGGVRDRLSADHWALLQELDMKALRAASGGRRAFKSVSVAEEALRRLSALAGVAMENTPRGPNWLFADLGKRLERGIATLGLLAALPEGEAGRDAPLLEALLELADSQITFAARYLAEPEREAVLDLVALDGSNPRSVVFQTDRIEEHLRNLPGKGGGLPGLPMRLAAGLGARLRLMQAQELTPAAILQASADLSRLSVEIGQSFFTHTAAIETVDERHAL
jgi:uncharacterized circularly permuted ATP-grasp superfamily protein/uncharacterized alpha-E superfamily protein